MRRLLLGGFAVLVLLLLAAPLALKLALERGVFTAALDAALERATGRHVALGEITLTLSLPPHVTVRDARIANLPGNAQPDFARVGRLETRFALLPLLRGEFEIRDLLLAEAELWFERDAAGQPNWVFSGGGPSGAGGGMPLPALRIEASRIHPPDDLPGPLNIESLSFQRLPDGRNLQLQGRLRLREEALRIEASFGLLSQPVSPLRATLAGEGFRITAEGQIAWRLSDPGWSLALAAEVASPARLMGLLGSTARLPPLGPLSGTAKLGPNGRLTELAVRSGASEPFPGWRVTTVALTAAGLDQPMLLAAAGPRGRLEVTLPAPRIAFTTSTSMAVTARATAGGARLTAQGRLTWSRITGPFDVTLIAPDLAPLGPLVGVELPAWRQVEARGRITRTGPAALRWEGAQLSAAGLAASGALEFGWAPRPILSGTLHLATLELDTLLPPGPARPAAGRVIPELALPVAALRGLDARLDLTGERITAAGLIWRGLRTRATLQAGRLELADLAVTTPGGTVAGRLGWDVASTPPRATLALRSTGHGIDVAAIRRELGAGIGVQGPVELALDLRAQGATTRALAASLSGAIGLAMVEGRLSQAGMLRIGPDLTRVLLMGRAPPDRVEIRCFALSFAAEDGLLRSEALLLESSAGRISGNLAVNLRNETIAAHLRPDLRVFGATMRAPVGVGGTLAAPRVGVEPGQALAQVVGDAVANRLWRSSTVEWLRRDTGDADCPAQLRQARLGQSGREPAAPAPIIPLVPRELQAPVQEVFRGLGSGIGGLLGGRR